MINIYLLLYGWLMMAVIMGLLWVWQARTNNPSVVDPMWAIGLFLLTMFYGIFVPGMVLRKIMVVGVVGIWSLRLSWHLIKRIKNLTEDGRYTEMRERWGKSAPWYFFIFFQIQAFWSVMFSLAPMVAMNNPNELGVADLCGLIIWLVAIGGESLADKQLMQFRRNPTNKGKVCNIGLWRYSRHPNYFFEWLHWWAYVAFSTYYPWGFLSLAGPSVMLFFLLKVTGVPPTEAQSLRTRGDAYRQYQKTTSVFFPWPPKK